MTATFTFDPFSSLDGYGSYGPGGDWGGYWSKEGPEFLARRLELLSQPQRMVLGGNTFREFQQILGTGSEGSDDLDPVTRRMKTMPATVISNSLSEPLDWPDATLASGDAVEVVARLKEESDVPLRSHGSLTLNRALLAAGLVDFIQVSIFPVITGQTGTHPVLADAADLDLELVESRLFDGRIQELVYRPTLH